MLESLVKEAEDQKAKELPGECNAQYGWGDVNCARGRSVGDEARNTGNSNWDKQIFGNSKSGTCVSCLPLLASLSLTRMSPLTSVQLFYISAGIYAVSALICQFCCNPPRLPTRVGTVGSDWAT
jgi:hypothetical protein